MKWSAAPALFCLLFFCSCQKEIEPLIITSRTDSTITSTNDSTALIKYVDLDTTLPSGMDTSIIQTYKYDALKRIIQSDYTEYLNSGLSQRNNRTLLFYNGSDTVPYKKTDMETYVQINNPSGYASVAYYTYANGRLTGDSVYSTSQSGTYSISRRFGYSGNSIIETIHRYLPAPVTEVHNVSFVRSNRNTVSQQDTTDGGLTPQHFSFVYDNKPNPFYNKPQSYISDADPYYTMETLLEDIVYEANNPIEINEYSGTENFHVKIVYQYKANGYPSSSTVTDLSTGAGSNPGFWYKRLYFYTKL